MSFAEKLRRRPAENARAQRELENRVRQPQRAPPPTASVAGPAAQQVREQFAAQAADAARESEAATETAGAFLEARNLLVDGVRGYGPKDRPPLVNALKNERSFISPCIASVPAVRRRAGLVRTSSARVEEMHDTSSTRVEAAPL